MSGTSTADLMADLTRRLATLGAASVLVGATLSRSQRPAVRAFGQQSAAWGAVDLGIVAVSRLRARPVDGRRLRTILAVNTVADVGYVVTGLYLALRRPTFGGRLSQEQVAGHGWAVVLHGKALALLDVTALRRS